MSNSGSSLHEDLPVKYPIRLDKNLVKRQLPQRKINNQKFNFCYDNHYEDLNMNNQINNSFENEQSYQENNNYQHHHHHHQRNHTGTYLNENMINYDNEMENNNEKLYQERKYEDDRFSSNNLDLKIYQEDITNKINNGKY